MWFLLKKQINVSRKLIDEKLRYYEKVFDEGEQIEKKGEYWRSELEPLLLGRLLDFETIKQEF